MSRGLSLKTMCDLCMAFSLFSSFMFPMRMTNPSSQSCIPSFQTLPYFLPRFPLSFSSCCLFQSSLSIHSCPNSICCGFSLPPKAVNNFSSQELSSDFQETIFMPIYQLCRAREIRTLSAALCPWWTVTSGLFNLAKLVKKRWDLTEVLSQHYLPNHICRYKSASLHLYWWHSKVEKYPQPAH